MRTILCGLLATLQFLTPTSHALAGKMPKALQGTYTRAKECISENDKLVVDATGFSAYWTAQSNEADTYVPLEFRCEVSTIHREPSGHYLMELSCQDLANGGPPRTKKERWQGRRNMIIINDKTLYYRCIVPDAAE